MKSELLHVFFKLVTFDLNCKVLFLEGLCWLALILIELTLKSRHIVPSVLLSRICKINRPVDQILLLWLPVYCIWLLYHFFMDWNWGKQFWMLRITCGLLEVGWKCNWMRMLWLGSYSWFLVKFFVERLLYLIDSVCVNSLLLCQWLIILLDP